MSRLKSWGLIYKLYTDENRGYFNEGWGYSQHPQNAWKPGEYGLWMNALRPYYRDEEMRFCPTAVREVEAANDWGTFKAWFKDAPNRYPAGGEAPQKHFLGSYSTNDWTVTARKGVGHRPATGSGRGRKT